MSKPMQQSLFQAREVSDPCAGKHRGADTSIAANKKAEKGKVTTTKRIYEFGLSVGSFTLQDASNALQKDKNAISGRFAPMVKAGLLKVIGVTDDHFRIYKVVRIES